MRQRFKARELWLFAPFLLIGAAALFYRRWEQVNPPEKRGMYVAKIERTTATGFDESHGVSHYVTVTLSHSWPRPLWWGQKANDYCSVDPLHPEQTAKPFFRATADCDFANGAVLVGERAGQKIKLKSVLGSFPGDVAFDGTNYKIRHSVGLRQIPPSVDEIKFESLYRWNKIETAISTKVVRAKNETFPAIDKNPGIRLISLKATDWTNTQMTTQNGIQIPQDVAYVDVIVESTLPSTRAKETGFSVYQEDIHDGAKPSHRFGYSIVGWGKDEDKPKVKLGQLGRSFGLIVDKTTKTTGKINLTIEASANSRWPLILNLELPPRPTAATAPHK